MIENIWSCRFFKAFVFTVITTATLLFAAPKIFALPFQDSSIASPLSFNSISLGENYACGVKTNGNLTCWGNNSYGQSSAPSGTFSQVSASQADGIYSCAVRTDGTIACWGNNDLGQASPPAGSFTEVSTGRYHACGVKTDGTLACWGLNTLGQATPPPGTFTQVSAGSNFSCGLRTDGTVACWGENSNGQATAPAGSFTAVSAGFIHSCGLRADGSIACWGDNGYGESAPQAGTFTQVSAGFTYTCGLKTDGTASCWGHNQDGQATAPAGIFREVSTGYNHSCGVQFDGTPLCWGNNNFGKASPPAGTFSKVAVSAGYYHTCGLKEDATIACWGENSNGRATAPAGKYAQVSAGTDHNCVLQGDGTVMCWGGNDFGQATPPSGTFTELVSGYLHTCGLKTDGTVACWGNSWYNQTTPPAETFTQITAGDWHNCGLKTDGTIACWGADFYGQSEAPAGTFTHVGAGYGHACGIRTDGTVTCWGYNSDGQINAPAGTFVQLGGGVYYTCGLRTDGTVTCWGSQLPPSSGTYKYLSAGGYHTCAVKTDGTYVCWADNTQGQAPVVNVAAAALGDGTAGSGYSETLSASGGLAPYAFRVVAGSLPPGLTMAQNGAISGTPTTPSSNAFTVQAIDVNNLSGERNFSLTVNPAISRTLNMTITGSGSGSITGVTDATPATLLFTTSGSSVISSGALVSLSPAAAVGSSFGGWTGCDSVAGNSCQVMMSSDRTVAASFALNQYQLSYSAGTNGTISGSTLQTVNYGGSGTQVTAVANAGYHFVSWSDGVTSAARTDTNVQANTNVTATFAINPYIFEGFFSPVDSQPMLNVTKAGQAVPVKWRIADSNGVAVSDPASFVSITSYPVSCSNFNIEAGDVIEEVAIGSSGLQYLGQGYWQYNWKTSKNYAQQCHVMVLNLRDSTKHSANFSFTK